MRFADELAPPHDSLTATRRAGQVARRAMIPRARNKEIGEGGAGAGADVCAVEVDADILELAVFIVEVVEGDVAGGETVRES